MHRRDRTRTRKDDRGRPTVYALLPSELKHLFHVGRLDRLTEGLLMFTNDGEAANRLLHPSGELARRYEGEVDGLLTADQYGDYIEREEEP